MKVNLPKMRYVPLRIFNELTEGEDLFAEEGIKRVQEKLTSEQAVHTAINAGFTIQDVVELTNSLSSSYVILFQNWIAQNQQLESFLVVGNAKSEFHDIANIQAHQYFSQFKKYISPFLSIRLLESKVENIEQRKFLFTYVGLLDGDHRGVVEDQLFKPIRAQLEHVKAELKLMESSKEPSEQFLIDLIQPLCASEYIDIANLLSKSSYALKLMYVDIILSAINSKSCTARFANWVIKQMEQLKLNNEHAHKIAELRVELRDGKLEIKNKGIGKTPFRFRVILPVITALAILFITLYIVYAKPFSEVEAPETEQASSFTQFTKEERKKLDSLIQTMSSQLTPELEQIDGNIPIGINTTISYRQPFTNELMEGIYTDLSKDASIQMSQAVDTCQQLPKKFKRYTGVGDLLQRQGAIECVIKNESDYDAVLYVSEDKTNGKVYSLYLKQKSTRVFKLNKGDVLLVEAGNIYIPYKAPKSYPPSDLPSKDFKYHFCDTDINYQESINKGYKYSDGSSTSTKFMLMGSPGSYFQLMDIYGVLTDY